MAGYIGNKAVGINVTTGDILGDVGVGGNIDVDGISNLDVVDIDGAVNMATTLETSGTVTVKHTDGVANVSLSPTSTGGVINVRNSSGVGVITLDGRNGLATIGNKLILTDGNLVVAAGHGIDFSAQTQSGSTTTAELLDHYETGTFTITLVTGGGSLTVDGSHNIGFYTRIGGIVHIGARISLSAASSPSGHIRIRGLPFTQLDTGEDSELNPVTINIYNPATAPTGVFVAEMNDDGTDGILIRDGGSHPDGVLTCANHFDAGSLIGFTATYRHA